MTTTNDATPEPWTELPNDPEHPTYENAPKFLIAQHWHRARHDATDTFVDLPVSAVHISDGLSGELIEFGPWSFTTGGARDLARTLLALADAADPNRLEDD